MKGNLWSLYGGIITSLLRAHKDRNGVTKERTLDAEANRNIWILQICEPYYGRIAFTVLGGGGWRRRDKEDNVIV